jgi:CheY-like chemotaxis protein
MLRQRHEPGILILTGAVVLVDRVVGLAVGADDYLAKPVELAELGAHRGDHPPPAARGRGPCGSVRIALISERSSFATKEAASCRSVPWRSSSSPPSPPTAAILTRDRLMQLAPRAARAWTGPAGSRPTRGIPR